MSKYIVTGGAGFIGSHIVEKLLKKGDEVTVIDDLSTGDLNNLASFKQGINFVNGSILDLDLLKREFTGASAIFHQAAIPSVPQSISDPIMTNEVNVGGTLNIFMAAKECGVKRVVYASSCAVYGDSPELPKREVMDLNPLSPYALHKLISEKYAKLFSKLFGVETVGLRYFNVFGPRQNMKSDYAAVVPIFIKQILQSKKPIIYGDGKTTRDFIFVKDVAEANILAASAENISGKTFNIGSGTELSLNDLVVNINQLTKKDIKPNYEDFKVGDIHRSVADVTLAREQLNFSNTTDFQEGLKETIHYYSN